MLEKLDALITSDRFYANFIRFVCGVVGFNLGVSVILLAMDRPGSLQAEMLCKIDRSDSTVICSDSKTKSIGTGSVYPGSDTFSIKTTVHRRTE